MLRQGEDVHVKDEKEEEWEAGRELVKYFSKDESGASQS